MEQVTRATMPQEAWGDDVSDWENLDWSSWSTEQEQPKMTTQQSNQQENLMDKIRRLEEELMAYRQQLFMQQLASAINNKLTGFFQQNPDLQLWEEELRSKTWARLVEHVSREVANAGNDQQKLMQIYDINKLADKAFEIFSEEAQKIKSKIEQIKGGSLMSPTSLPPTSANVSTTTKTEENVPGQRIPIYEDEENVVDLYIVPETYLEKMRKKQLQEWLKERMKLDNRRKRALEMTYKQVFEEKP